MLKIQRASAGSGKTYALAKDYILNLIAYRKDDGEWQLRTYRQIEDALLHILAITFTNKATNEMKVRIIDNLALLATAKDDLNDSQADKIPYLREFSVITNAPYSKIGENASTALKVLLNNYSNFKISTIDSFFQEILRTFAYEANLSDSYQLEIDSSFVTDSALDAAINELDYHPENMGNASFWLKIIIKNEALESQRWNLFNKRASSRSIYAKLRKALIQLEKEDFKIIKEQIDSYFNEKNVRNLPKIYQNFKDAAVIERNTQLKKIKNTLAKVENLMTAYNLPEDNYFKTFLNHLPLIAALKPKDKFKNKFDSILIEKSVFKKKYRTPDHPLDEAAFELYELLKKWNEPDPSSIYKGWLVFGELFPYFGLIIEIRSFLAEVLETNNLIQLSDTSYILKKIIGEDDAPFVYERLGNRIDNYLIDEFQDTSRLQWDIIHPLLDEGIARNKESLIIGDPKQSIYRFRNADHTLITSTVPDTYVDHISAGMTKEENTNWRSNTNIVKFNNLLFRNLASVIYEISKARGNNTDFINLYSNVVQYPHNQKGKGYVEIRIFQKPQENSDETEENDNIESGKTWFESKSLSNIGPLVSSLKEKGYSQNDIAILVNTNANGKNIVEELIRYNKTVSSEKDKINFISEESLLISSSPAVSIIIELLKNLANPISIQNKIKEDSSQRKYYNWDKLKFHFEIFSRKNQGLSLSQRMILFLKDPDFSTNITSLMKELPSPDLTGITEEAIKSLLNDELRKTEALYLASFQDIVKEYTDNHGSDISSFLDWWNSRGSSLSVASPDGIDAIQIMTIHKSKGLEFKCVIIPFTDDSMVPTHQKQEWRWIDTTEFSSINNLNLPPIMPVETNKELIGSVFENVYKAYYDQVLTDRLNMYYVAFTRAKDELYIFTKEPGKNAYTINSLLFKILKEAYTQKEEVNDVNVLSSESIVISKEEDLITIGTPMTKEEIKEEYQRELEKDHMKKAPEKHIFSGYFVNSKRPKLKSLVGRVSPSGEFIG